MKKIHDRFLGRFCRSQSHKKGKEKIFFWAMTWVFERGRGNSIYLLPSNIDSLHLRVFLNSLPGHMVDESKSKSVDMLWEGNIDMVEIPLDYMEAEAYSQLNQGSTI